MVQVVVILSSILQWFLAHHFFVNSFDPNPNPNPNFDRCYNPNLSFRRGYNPNPRFSTLVSIAYGVNACGVNLTFQIITLWDGLC